MAESRFRHGTVLPSMHEGEWTFNYFVDGKEVVDEHQQITRTYSSAANAKQAMRDKIDELRSKEKINHKVYFDWRMNWDKQPINHERFGQAFCNHFYNVIGRGDHTQRLFYTTSRVEAEAIIHQEFIDYGQTVSS